MLTEHTEGEIRRPTSDTQAQWDAQTAAASSSNTASNIVLVLLPHSQLHPFQRLITVRFIILHKFLLLCTRWQHTCRT
jgi:hypothetical protein